MVVQEREVCHPHVIPIGSPRDIYLKGPENCAEYCTGMIDPSELLSLALLNRSAPVSVSWAVIAAMDPHGRVSNIVGGNTGIIGGIVTYDIGGGPGPAAPSE